MNTDNLPPLPEPALVIGTKLLPYEERHFSTQDLAVRLGYREGIRSYYTTAQVEEIRRAAILAERERFRAMFDESSFTRRCFPPPLFGRA